VVDFLERSLLLLPLGLPLLNLGLNLTRFGQALVAGKLRVVVGEL
jgi:hypothetical protein